MKRHTQGDPGVPPVDFAPTKLVRVPRVVVRHAGPLVFLSCGGCGAAGDLERDAENLSIAEVRHVKSCPVSRALWRGFMSSKFNENGRPRRRWKTATIGGAA